MNGLGEDEAADDQVLPGCHIEELGGEHEQGIEPASRLVHGLCERATGKSSGLSKEKAEGGGSGARTRNELSREGFFKLLFVLERIMDLCVGHAVRRTRKTFSTMDWEDARKTLGSAHLPDSNQQSKTSSTRRSRPLPFFEGMVMPSIDSRWRSSSRPQPESSLSSAIEPTQTTSSKSSDTQIGSGVPQ